MITPKVVAREIKKYDDRINPDEEDYMIIRNLTWLLIDTVAKVTPKYISSYVDCIPGGSSSRNTFLPGKLEIDLFIRFKTENRQVLEDFAEMVVPKIGEILGVETDLRYSENPYGHLKIVKGSKIVSVDLVATIFAKNTKKLQNALKISGMARTPFHSKYLEDKIKGKELEIRALKFWLRQKKCYGRASITGFLSELLIIEYDSFYEVLKVLPELSEIYIDPFDRTKVELKELFPQDFVIIVDPTDKVRNAAAGIQGFIGKIKLNRLADQSKKSLKYAEKIFKCIKIPNNNIETIINFDRQPKNEDDKFFMLARLARKIHNEAAIYQYNIVDVFVMPNLNKIILCPELDSFEKKYKVIKGPPLHLKLPVKKFKSVHKETWVRNERIYTKVENKYQTMHEIIEEILRNTEKNSLYISSFKIKVNFKSGNMSSLMAS